MSVEQRPDGSLWIEEYSLCELVLAVQKHAKEGFEVSLENHNYPQGFSGHFTVGMILSETDTPTDAETPRTDALDAPVARVELAVVHTPPVAQETPVSAPKKASTRAKPTA